MQPRPEFRHPARGATPTQIEFPGADIEVAEVSKSKKLPWPKRLPQLVETLVSLGGARYVDGGVLSVD